MEEKLRLRDELEIRRISHLGEDLFYISCRLGISEPVGLKILTAPVLALLAGSYSRTELYQLIQAQGLDLQLAETLIQLLEEKLILDSPAFRLKKEEMLNTFLNNEIREPSHAGLIYPDSKSGTEELLRQILSAASAATQTAESELLCLVAPHIDYNRGFSGYAHAYRHLVNCKPDICILMGTSHRGGQSLFQLSRKHFRAPNALLKNALEFTENILKDYGENRGLADEFLHKNEHSLDLQLPFLAYYCPETRIVPVLVNSFAQFLRGGQRPEDIEEYVIFVKSLAKNIQHFSAAGKKILIIAGVDMAHIGLDFGDNYIIEQQHSDACRQEDLTYLNHLKTLSSPDMFQHIMKDFDKRRICGFSSLHTIIDVLRLCADNFRVNLDDYQQALDQEKRCMVSFAAASIYVPKNAA